MLTFKPITMVSLFAMMLSLGSTPARAQVETNELHNERRESVQGTWKCKVDRMTPDASFNVFMSFAAGGVVVGTGSLDKLNPVSAVFGSWKQTRRNRVNVTIYFYLFDPIGNPLGTLKTNETFRLDDQNKITGTGSLLLATLLGKIVATVQ